MNNSCRFEDYIVYLRDNINNLIEYREGTGTLDPHLLQIRSDLFNQDPFVVLSATLAATRQLSNKTLYH